jgi:clan AA aspartic protease (TIGR02281 family)
MTRRIKKVLLASTCMAIMTSALARDYSNDMLCHITDTQGHELIYAFTASTEKDYMVETGFTGNGKDIGWPEGQMPKWHWHKPVENREGIWLLSQVNPGWGLFLEGLYNDNGIYRTTVTLMHETNVLGTGQCARRAVVAPTTPAPTQQAPRSSGDSIALQTQDGRAFYLNVFVGGAGNQRFLLDTGATNMSINESLADNLVQSGYARDSGSTNIMLADGSTRPIRVIVIKTLVIGNHTLHNIAAGTAPDGADMLLGMAVLNQIGPFRLDAANLTLTFG